MILEEINMSLREKLVPNLKVKPVLSEVECVCAWRLHSGHQRSRRKGVGLLLICIFLQKKVKPSFALWCVDQHCGLKQPWCHWPPTTCRVC